MTPIILEINEEEINFNLTPQLYNQYINELSPANKVTPSVNFCHRAVDEKDEKKLKEILQAPGAVLEIAGTLVQEYAPSIGALVKKPKAVVRKSKTTDSNS